MVCFWFLYEKVQLAFDFIPHLVCYVVMWHNMFNNCAGHSVVSLQRVWRVFSFRLLRVLREMSPKRKAAATWLRRSQAFGSMHVCLRKVSNRLKVCRVHWMQYSLWLSWNWPASIWFMVSKFSFLYNFRCFVNASFLQFITLDCFNSRSLFAFFGYPY